MSRALRPRKRARNASTAAVTVAAGPRLETHNSLIALPGEHLGDRRVVDLPGAGLAPAGYVGHLDLTYPGQRLAHQLDQVPLTDLGVVEVEIHPQMWTVDGPDQRHRVRCVAERRARVVDRDVEVLQGEHDVVALPQVGDLDQRRLSRQPHLAGDHVHRADREALPVQAGAVQVQVRGAERT